MKKIVLAVFFVILILAFFLTFSNKFNFSKQNPQKNLSESSSSASTSNPNSLERCDIKKATNPLLEVEAQVINSNKGEELVGSFKGNIQDISLSADNLSALIEVSSLLGAQRHTFNIKAEGGLSVFNITKKKDLTIVDLKKGQTISLTFSCPKAQKDLFKITKITVY